MPFRAISRAWLAASALALVGAAPSAAAPVTVVMTGTWTSVVDTASVLDGSITTGGSFTATFTYDDATPDSNPLTETGDYLMNGSVGTLRFSTGNYSFIDAGTSANGVTIDNDNAGSDAVFIFFDRFVASGPLPAGVALKTTAYANPSLIDDTATALSTDQLTGVAWDAVLYSTNFYFFGPITGRGAQDFIELDGVINKLTVIPEPAASVLAAFGLAGLLLRRRCR